MSQSNYSFETSLPAYNANPNEKQRQRHLVKQQIKLLGDNACIKLIARNLNLPDATISARINDLKSDGEVEYYGKFKIEGMMRKKVRLVKKYDDGSQIKMEF